MQACKVPLSFNKSSILFSYEVFSYDDGTSAIECHHWHVKSLIRNKTYLSECGLRSLGNKRERLLVTLVNKIKGESWIDGKWAKSIPKHLIMKFELKDKFPGAVYTTKLQAIKFAVKHQKKMIAEAEKELRRSKSSEKAAEWEEELHFSKKELGLLNRAMSKLRRNK